MVFGAVFRVIYLDFLRFSFYKFSQFIQIPPLIKFENRIEQMNIFFFDDQVKSVGI